MDRVNVGFLGRLILSLPLSSANILAAYTSNLPSVVTSLVYVYAGYLSTGQSNKRAHVYDTRKLLGNDNKLKVWPLNTTVSIQSCGTWQHRSPLVTVS